jgi:hypothetical protein
MIRAVLAVALVAGCDTRVVDIGAIDAAVDGSIAVDASTCRCRITMCRVAGDCALIGGACGPDFYCVGDFGSCSTDLGCQATVTSSVCTQGAASTTPCR